MSRIAIVSAENLRLLETTTENIISSADRLICVTNSYGKTTIPETLKKLKENGILWQGRPVSRNLPAAAEAMNKNLNADARAVLRYLESKYGRSLLTDGPTKLYPNYPGSLDGHELGFGVPYFNTFFLMEPL